MTPSPVQLKTLMAIHRHQQTHGYAPSFRELCLALRIRSTNGVNEHVTSLERKGLVVRVPRIARSLQVTPAGAQALKGRT